jgi:organic radical activating enzyme
MNVQPISKQQINRDGVHTPLEIAHIFDSIQGEGPWQGLPVTFIRMAGCNLCCTWCDTDYRIRVLAYVDDFEHKKLKQHIVITGGEPFRQNITPLVQLLISKGKSVLIETNGTLYLKNFPYEQIFLVCSPKTPELNPELVPHIFAYKYVVSFRDAESMDGMPGTPTQKNGTKKPARPISKRNLVYLMPLDESKTYINLLNMDTCVHLAMKHDLRLCLQLHKILRIP